tara:strand:+ start:688 stop:828 length:141 start_codon:yes stop_codon:yes gene_type:complete
MSGYEKSPDYGGPQPGRFFYLWMVLFYAGLIAVPIGLFLLSRIWQG